MKPSLLAIRSIGADFGNRLFYPVVIIFIVVASLAVGLVAWLTSINEWWLLLAIPIVILVSAGIGVLVVTRLVIRTITPDRSSKQKLASKQIVDKLFNLSEAAQTPKFILLFRVVRDVAAPRENGFIGTLSHDTTSLSGDFKKLRDSFADS